MTRVRWSLLLLALLVALVVVGCELPEETDGPGSGAASETTRASGKTTKTTQAKPEADASAQLACTHFRNVMGDVDVLTVPELRAKLREVHETASVSEWEAVRTGARRMLAAVTRDDAEGLLDAAKGFSRVCKELGL